MPMPVKVFRNLDVLGNYDASLASYLSEELQLAVEPSEIIILAAPNSIRVPAHYYSQPHPPVESTLRTDYKTEAGRALWYRPQVGDIFSLNRKDKYGVLKWDVVEGFPRIFFGENCVLSTNPSPLGLVASLNENWALYVDDPTITTTNPAFIPRESERIAPPRYPEVEPVSFRDLIAKLEKQPD